MLGLRRGHLPSSSAEAGTPAAAAGRDEGEFDAFARDERVSAIQLRDGIDDEQHHVRQRSPRRPRLVRMRSKKRPNHDHSCRIVYGRDQSVVVALDVEYHSTALEDACLWMRRLDHLGRATADRRRSPTRLGIDFVLL